jgi:hypothetical protein
MLNQMRPHRAAALVLMVLAFAGCGGGESGNQTGGGEDLLARCESGSSPQEGPQQEMVEQVCREAVDRGLMDDGELSRDDFLSVLRDQPSLFSPSCVEAANQGFAALPTSSRRLIDVTPEAWGEMFCNAVVQGDYIAVDGSLPPASLTRLYRDHPELGAPFFFAGLMETYDPSTGISKATWERISRKMSTEAFRRGIVTATSLSSFDYDRDAAIALFQEIAAEVQGG